MITYDILSLYMAYDGSVTAGNEDAPETLGSRRISTPKVAMGRKLFVPKTPGSPGKLSLGKTSTTAQSLAKLRGKGALA